MLHSIHAIHPFPSIHPNANANAKRIYRPRFAYLPASAGTELRTHVHSHLTCPHFSQLFPNKRRHIRPAVQAAIKKQVIPPNDAYG